MASWSRSRSWRILCLLTLCCFLVGCSGFRSTALSLPSPAGNSADSDGPPTVKKGHDVLVILVSGKQMTGTVVEVTSESLTIAKGGNYGLEETEIPFDEIRPVSAPRVSAVQAVGSTLAFFGIAIGALLALFVIECSTSDCWGS